ncbi:hypothetical protein FKM82_018639 [Ascaphus truei]
MTLRGRVTAGHMVPRHLLTPRCHGDATQAAESRLTASAQKADPIPVCVQESRLNAKVLLKQKSLQVQLDLKRFRIYSNKSAFESLALIPLQSPLKTLLQMAVIPVLNGFHSHRWRPTLLQQSS